MRIFAVWREKEKIKIIEPMIPIEKALYWYEAKTELLILMEMIPIDADMIQAEYSESAIKKFIEYEKAKAANTREWARSLLNSEIEHLLTEGRIPPLKTTEKKALVVEENRRKRKMKEGTDNEDTEYFPPMLETSDF